ncbi:hypothetical protein AKO1_005935 [Acrasis kona]|uniref:Uncharacterized protein n=1 Tax=Acrasis kona TaxID=1008807 RepID=A0AAW2YKM0_9EUKA
MENKNRPPHSLFSLKGKRSTIGYLATITSFTLVSFYIAKKSLQTRYEFELDEKERKGSYSTKQNYTTKPITPQQRVLEDAQRERDFLEARREQQKVALQRSNDYENVPALPITDDYESFPQMIALRESIGLNSQLDQIDAEHPI